MLAMILDAALFALSLFTIVYVLTHWKACN